MGKATDIISESDADRAVSQVSRLTFSGLDRNREAQVARLIAMATAGDLSEWDQFVASQPGIYLILNFETRAEYIGKSENLMRRVCRHAKHIVAGTHPNKRIRESFPATQPPCCGAMVLQYCRIYELEGLERRWIAIRNPSANAVGGGGGGKSKYRLNKPASSHSPSEAQAELDKIARKVEWLTRVGNQLQSHWNQPAFDYQTRFLGK